MAKSSNPFLERIQEMFRQELDRVAAENKDVPAGKLLDLGNRDIVEALRALVYAAGGKSLDPGQHPFLASALKSMEKDEAEATERAAGQAAAAKAKREREELIVREAKAGEDTVAAKAKDAKPAAKGGGKK